MAALCGESHPGAKLTREQVDQIRDMHELGSGYKTLAKRFNVSRRLIQRICKYERWARYG
jgi:DNA invertase Pin-like site-specific DNA recombinase